MHFSTDCPICSNPLQLQKHQYYDSWICMREDHVCDIGFSKEGDFYSTQIIFNDAENDASYNYSIKADYLYKFNYRVVFWSMRPSKSLRISLPEFCLPRSYSEMQQLFNTIQTFQ